MKSGGPINIAMSKKAGQEWVGQDIPEKPVQNSSPKPEKIVEMETFTFPDALREVLIGKRLTRIDWASKEEYMYYDEKVAEYLIIHTLGQDHIFNLRGTDMDATDWYVLPEEK